MNAQDRLEEGRPMIRWWSTPNGVLQAVLMNAWQLRRECREVYVLCDIQGCSVTETADTLGMTLETVMTRLKSARSQMEGAINRLCEPNLQ